MPHVPGLRSCYDKVGRLVYFGRMLDKIRLHAADRLPATHVATLGDAQPYVLDSRCCRFLGVHFADLTTRTLAGGTDGEILAWAHAHGLARSDEDCHMWNHFILKLGWRDERSAVLRQLAVDSGLADRPIETIVDQVEYNEGRDPVGDRAWEKI